MGPSNKGRLTFHIVISLKEPSKGAGQERDDKYHIIIDNKCLSHIGPKRLLAKVGRSFSHFSNQYEAINKLIKIRTYLNESIRYDIARYINNNDNNHNS